MKGQLDYIKYLFVLTFQISVVLIDVFKLLDAQTLCENFAFVSVKNYNDKAL